MTALDNLVVGVALPSIRADLGGSLESLEWTVNAYTLAFAVLLLTGAALGDRFGRKRMFVDRARHLHRSRAPLAALAPSRRHADRGRARLQGVGAAIVTPLTLTLVSEAFPPERRGAGARASGAGSAASASRSARSSAAPIVAGDRLAVDLLAERPDRPRAGPAGRRAT